MEELLGLDLRWFVDRKLWVGGGLNTRPPPDEKLDARKMCVGGALIPGLPLGWRVWFRRIWR